MTSLRSLLLYCIRALGGFSVARYLTRRSLRILCYHGFSVGDEHEVMPFMFMRPETFERRMRLLKKWRIPVLPLNEAVKRFNERAITDAETVITFDDGWTTNLTIGVPILENHGYPVCIYISTEHLAASTEVFNVALYYLLHKADRRSLTLVGVHPEVDGTYALGANAGAATRDLIAAAERTFPLPQRQRLLGTIAEALGENMDELLTQDRFRLLSREQVQVLFRRGVDIQLHTHTHRLPDADFELMAREIEDNRRALKEVIGTEACHFCYPSGQYSEFHPAWLARVGIVSATTCDPGLNSARASVMLLKRYLDSEHSSDIAFEAEVCGVRELARWVRTTLRHGRH